MSEQTWSTIDKSEWGAGEWQQEPDKVQWVDEVTGLDCLVVRGPSGALCGYVGVAEGHPYFRKDYDDCDVRVHGGLTFANACQEPTREQWEKWRASMRARADEAVRFPKGDMAEAFRERGHLLDDYEAWREHAQTSGICHIPQAGRPEHVWWLGFDCAHSGDMCPKYAGEIGGSLRDWETYRDLDYVRGECRDLAIQLLAAAP